MRRFNGAGFAVGDFAERSDRDEPLRFVGREALFRTLERRLRNTRKAGKTLSNGLFIKGAPGAGKSTFLAEVQKRFA